MVYGSNLYQWIYGQNIARFIIALSVYLLSSLKTKLIMKEFYMRLPSFGVELNLL
jgi:hypothetical protein